MERTAAVKGVAMSRLAVCEAPIEHRDYRGFRVFEFRRSYYGVPVEIVHIPRIEIERAFVHPAVVVAPTRGGLEALIDGFDPTPFRRERAGRFEDHDIIRHADTYYGVPRIAAATAWCGARLPRK
jgi:hypothetical protein